MALWAGELLAVEVGGKAGVVLPGAGFAPGVSCRLEEA
jgi:hypothetical protein